MIAAPPHSVASPGYSPKIHQTSNGPMTISSMVISETSAAGR